MKDRQFLALLHERLQYVHKENPHFDYMHKLRAIIKNTPEYQTTPNRASGNTLEDVL